jgi:hypothetical protein
MVRPVLFGRHLSPLLVVTAVVPRAPCPHPLECLLLIEAPTAYRRHLIERRERYVGMQE